MKPSWRPEPPKILTTLSEGYGLTELRQDALAGLTVAIVALPLAMALAIASGTTPEKGLFTAVIAGFLISLFGGSRYQIGGPTGAFVVVVFTVIERHGYDGLIIATLMAGVFLIVFSLARLGTVIRFIPYPVVTGFTAGIAVIIFSTQIKDFFGLRIAEMPGALIDKWEAYFDAAASWQPATFGLAFGSLALILGLRRYYPRLPGFIAAVVLASLATWVFALPVDTIGSRFGGIPQALPVPQLPAVTWERVVALVPDAFTIALLAGIESLLSAMIADGMTGGRHRSNAELMGQGIANIGSALFGGLPATGAIARTVTNIKSGGRTPMAGILHAAFLLLFMLLLAPLASYIPLACLAAILIVVAWNMSEIERFKSLMKAPPSDRLVLLTTFLLTVLVDLTVAIEVGIVLSAMIFMKRMSEVTEIGDARQLLDPAAADPEDPDSLLLPGSLPKEVEVFQIKGPFFFGVASRLLSVLDQLERPPKVFILRLRHAPLIDASGVAALEAFLHRCRQHGTQVVLTGVQAQPREVLRRMDWSQGQEVPMVADLGEALRLADRILAENAAGT